MINTADMDIAMVREDPRLTEPSDGKRFNWRELIKKVEELGRPLSEEEAQPFLIVH